MNEFEQKLDAILAEIKAEVIKAHEQIDAGVEALNKRNDYISYATGYLGRASEGLFRNIKEDHNPKEMLVKAAGILVSAIKKEF